MIGIYLITNKINGKKYVGQSIDIQRRFYEHRCISHETNVHLKYALKKYGKDNFEQTILEECTVDELDEKEIYYIQKLQPEYNVSYGGQNNLKIYPNYVKEKISQKSKEQWNKMTEAEKQHRVRNNLTGQGWNKGIPCPDNVKQRLREANLGKKQSEETKNKRKATFSKRRENGIKKDGSGHFKRIICTTTGEIFKSVKSANEYYDIPTGNISHVLKGKYKTTHGLHFEYYNSVETIPDEFKEVE